MTRKVDPTENRYESMTADGLALRLSPDGTFSSLNLDSDQALSPASASGIWVKDIQTESTEQFLGHVEIRPLGSMLTGIAEESELKLVAEFIPEDTTVRIKGYVENQAERMPQVFVML